MSNAKIRSAVLLAITWCGIVLASVIGNRLKLIYGLAIVVVVVAANHLAARSNSRNEKGNLRVEHFGGLLVLSFISLIAVSNYGQIPFWSFAISISSGIFMVMLIMGTFALRNERDEQ